jgi:hypothetical protein
LEFLPPQEEGERFLWAEDQGDPDEEENLWERRVSGELERASWRGMEGKRGESRTLPIASLAALAGRYW